MDWAKAYLAFNEINAQRHSRLAGWLADWSVPILPIWTSSWQFLHQVNVLRSSISLKVQLFWEDHNNLCNHPYGFDIYLVNVRTIRTIAQLFVAFLEKLNFRIATPIFNVCHKYFVIESRSNLTNFRTLCYINSNLMNLYSFNYPACCCICLSTYIGK